MSDIVAMIKMEEKYESLTLSFDKCDDTVSKIEAVVESVMKDTGMNPVIFQKEACSMDGKESVYVEFTDQEQRESGKFFDAVLEKLGIQKCIS